MSEPAKLSWEPVPGEAEVFRATYRGRRLEIRPCGEGWHYGTINGRVSDMIDNRKALAASLRRMVDKLPGD